MPYQWSFNEIDAAIANDLSPFLPERIFDAHAHIYRMADLIENTPPSEFSRGPEVGDIAAWRGHIGRHAGERRLVGGLFLGAPFCHLDPMNDFLLEQLENNPQSRGAICISPDYPIEKVAGYISHPAIAGLKPYQTLSSEIPAEESSIHSYLPEWAWGIADQHSLTITLHLAKSRALADPDNQRIIRDMCRKYSRAKLILAHAAYGFHPPNLQRGIDALRGLDNVWFDTSAICESPSLIMLIREFGPERLLWGSDFPVSEKRGKYFSVGDGFAWATSESVDWTKISKNTHPTLVGLESLRALREAADISGLSEKDIQNIFCDNALRLLGILKNGEDQKPCKT